MIALKFHKYWLFSIALGLMGATYDTPDGKIVALGQAFQQLNVQIREQTISPDSAQQRFQEIMLQLQENVKPYSSDSTQDSLSFVFPVKGYTPRQIGGHGSGYRSRGFNLFDHSVQGSHPAHDIFIFDRNQDSMDDQTEQPVDVLAMHEGVVLATESNWQPESSYRGGNFVWIYSPRLNGLFYYAHHSKVVVQVGDYVSAGQKIAEVGRTGLNAAKPRSSTHLHLMYLQLLTPDALPEPKDTYEWLLAAQTME
jgi:peptidoglycan LD-endopeptidase LytH